ncbi:MAG: hypothetical protein AB2L20_14465 [Mangrovibacterium sp.]
MKNKSRLFILLAVLSVFAIGFLIGIKTNYPPVNNDEVVGTIGKVNNYRNTKVTETDIRLKNELLTDSVMLKHIINYMNFFYVRAVEVGKSIDFALSQTKANDIFKSKNAGQITELENYGKFLFGARKDLLIAIAGCYSIEQTDPTLLRNAMIRANNLIAQMNYRNNAVLNFINALDSFVQEQGPDKYPGLSKAHDLLTCNEVCSSLVLKNETLLNYFDKKKLYSKDTKPPVSTNWSERVKQDMESLGLSETAKFETILDVEKLEMVNMIVDMEKMNEATMDTEELRATFRDSEKLDMIEIVSDAEKLGGIVYFRDSGTLGAAMDELNDLTDNN